MKDVRWKQRFSNFVSAFGQLSEAVQTAKQRPLSNLEKQGLVKAFEFTHELAWNVMKDYLDYQGVSNIVGSRDATREAFRAKLIADGDSWMEMIQDRNQTAHTYNQSVADAIVKRVSDVHFQLFEQFKKKMEEFKS